MMKIIYSIFIAFIVAVALLLIVSIFPIPGNYKVMIVLSGSMEPAIKTGGIVVIKPMEDYRIGDVITFQRRGEKDSTTHRITDIRVEGGQPIYITQGDANNAPDMREVRNNEIEGRMLFSIPYLGYAVDFAKKPTGFALIIIIPAVIIIGDEVKKIIREIKNKNYAKRPEEK